MKIKSPNYYIILNFFREYQKKNKRPPTMREVMDATGITSTAVVRWHIFKAVEAGDMRRIGPEGQARNFEVVIRRKSQTITGGQYE